MIADRDSNATKLLRNIYKGAGLRERGVLDEAGGKLRVQDGVCLLREDTVQSVRARLDRLCSRRDLDFKGALRGCTVIQCGRGENVHVLC